MIFYIFISMILSLSLSTSGCARGSNPVRFDKVTIEDQFAKKEKTQQYTLLELYLQEKVDTDYMMAWFFENSEKYRYKLYYIKNQIKAMFPLSKHDEERILLLEYVMNKAIQRFNDKSLISRSREIISAAIQAYNEEEISNKDLKSVKAEGVSAGIISDDPIGYLGSFSKYGFKIEKVDFLD